MKYVPIHQSLNFDGRSRGCKNIAAFVKELAIHVTWQNFYLYLYTDILLLEGKLEEALYEFEKAQEAEILQYGKNHTNMLQILKRQLQCYIYLGDKKRAKKCVNELKRYGKSGGMMKTVKEMKHKIDLIKRDIKQSKNSIKDSICLACQF